MFGELPISWCPLLKFEAEFSVIYFLTTVFSRELKFPLLSIPFVSVNMYPCCGRRLKNEEV